MVTDIHWQDLDSQQCHGELGQHIVVKADCAQDKLCNYLEVCVGLLDALQFAFRHFPEAQDACLGHC